MSSITMTAAKPSFDDVGVPADLARALKRAGRSHPFAIQTASLPDALAGRDICGKAPTGSGKTLAFSIPAVALAKEARPNRPTVLILTPTRELAAQIRVEMQPLADARGVTAATFYGGTNINADIRALKHGCDIAIATPGRLEDLIQRRLCRLDDVGMVILDEADRMADMGFLPVVKRLLDQTPARRQTLLFSATLDGDIDVLIKRYQTNPARHEVAQPDEAKGDVTHHFWASEPLDRRDVAVKMLNKVDQAIVFARTKRGADRLARNLGREGISCVAIHGDRSQSQREKALHRFSTGQVKALIATDVAARGIHVDDVSAVLHYDLAGSDKDYVHRSGRTGRAGSTGIVVSLVRPEDKAAATKMLRDLGLTQRITDPQYDRLHEPAATQPSSDRGAPSAAEADRDASTTRSRQRPRGDARRGGRGEQGRGEQGRGEQGRGERSAIVRARQPEATDAPAPSRTADAQDRDGVRKPKRQRKGPNSTKNKGRPRRLREADRASYRLLSGDGVHPGPGDARERVRPAGAGRSGRPPIAVR